ncbi:hypothetical protein GIB67_037053, partial [Kingdonia uniflora]
PVLSTIVYFHLNNEYDNVVFFCHFTPGIFLLVKQTPSDSQLVKVASCTSMSDLFIRYVYIIFQLLQKEFF